MKKKAINEALQWYGPLLDALRELGGSGTPDEVVDRIAEMLKLPDEILNETTKSGQLRFKNQVAWARFNLYREGLLDSSLRGVWTLTEKGRKTRLTDESARELFLKWVDKDKLARAKPSADNKPGIDKQSEDSIPGDDRLDYRKALIELLRKLPPEGFERLSQRLLRESGFTQVEVTGRSGDGGIDGHGTLEINPLVTFRVLFQCKRYTGAVSPSQVRDFRGAMAGRSDKGIIITTGNFTAEARREASRDGATPIELIDGEKLVDMFEKLGIGLKPIKAYEIDDAFFEPYHSVK